MTVLHVLAGLAAVVVTLTMVVVCCALRVSGNISEMERQEELRRACREEVL